MTLNFLPHSHFAFDSRPARNHVTKPVGKEIRRVMTKIITAAVVGMVETAVAPPKITTTTTAPSASA